MDSDYYADLFYTGGEELLYEYKQKLLKDKKQMQIQILSVTPTQAMSKANKPYEYLEIAYKNMTYQGKVEGRKQMPYGANAGAFSVLKSAQPGQSYEITVSKGTSGYNDWTDAKLTSGEASVTPQATPAARAATTSAPARSSYETPEERAQRQVLIVRQSSLSAAVATLAVGSKSVKPDEVIAVAKQYENYVFDIKDPGPSGFEDLPDFDVPTVE